jgi:hypothetical protein
MRRLSNHLIGSTGGRRRGAAAVVTVLTTFATLVTFAGCSTSTGPMGPDGHEPWLAKSPGSATLALSVSPTAVSSGTAAQGTVTLGSPAGGKGTTVALSSSDPGVAGVPATVTVARGQTSATFAITTGPTAGALVTITAAQGRATSSALLTVTAPDLVSLVLNPSTIREGDTGTGTVTLSGPAPSAGVLVTLVSSDPAAVVPDGRVLVLNGQTSATFLVRGVSSASSVTITGTLGATTRSAQLTIQSAGQD